MEEHKRRILLTILIIVSLVFVCEMASREFILSPHRIHGQYNQDSQRKPSPYTMLVGEPGTLQYGERLNSKGYRGKEALSPKPEDEFRVIILGSSSVFAGNPTLVELLEGEFNKGGHKNVKCYNYGSVSSVSNQELVRLVLEVTDVDPDLIVMYNGLNDIFSPVNLDPRPGYPFNFVVFEKNPLLSNNIRLYPGFDLILYGSNVARLIAPKYFEKQFIGLEELKKEVGYMSEEWKQQIADIYVKNIGKTDVIARAFDSKFVAFFQPNLFFKEHMNKDEATTIQGKEVFIWTTFTYEMRSRIMAGIEVLQNEQGLKFVDLSNIFLKERNSVFSDYLHVKQEYMPEIASQIYLYLSEDMKK